MSNEYLSIDMRGLISHQKTMDRLFENLACCYGSRGLQGGFKSLYASIKSYLNSAETKIRKQMIKTYGANLPNDPRGAHISISRGKVHIMPGRSAIVGNVKIFNPRTAGSVKSSYEPIRKLDMNPRQRGGNRRPVSARTQKINSYGPRDRGFILRFLEDGTGQRQTRFGNRGSISPRGIFGHVAPFVVDEIMKEVAAKIEKRIEQLIEKGKLENFD